MGPFAPKPALHGAGSKVKWAISVSEQVNKLRSLVIGKIPSINLLLATHT